MSALPRVCVIVLNFNGSADTMECVQSLQKLNYPDFKVLLVDNASEDTSWKAIPKEFPAIDVLETGDNLGYAGGNNAGIRWALSHGFEDVLVLNNDLVVAQDALLILENFSIQAPHATLLGPKVLSYGGQNLIHSLGTSMDWWRLRPHRAYYGQPKETGGSAPRSAQIIPGSALLLKKRLLNEVGLFGEDYFLIHEDADLCLRNLRAGFQNVVVPAAHVYHKLSKTLSSYPFLSSYYSTRNFLVLSLSHASFFGKVATAAGLTALSVKNALRMFCSDKTEKERLSGFFSGVLDFARGRRGRRVPT